MDEVKVENRAEHLAYDANTWKSISLTHVEYPKGDLLGCVLAWISLLPLVILAGFATLIIFRRDLHTISYMMGILLSEAINWVLKHLIRETRPIRGRDHVTTEYGMPSSHAQFMWFFSTYLTFFLIIRVHHNVNKLENIWKYLTCLGGFILAALVCFGRVYLGYHTHKQVVFGGLTGAVSGIVWFGCVHYIFTPYFPAVAAWPVSEFLMIRDSTLIPNVLWFEYCSVRAEARTRRKALNRKSS